MAIYGWIYVSSQSQGACDHVLFLGARSYLIWTKGWSTKLSASYRAYLAKCTLGTTPAKFPENE